MITFSFVLPTIGVAATDDPTNKYMLYNVPFGANSLQVLIVFLIIAIVVPYLAIFIGYALAYVVVRIYCRFTKFSRRIEFVGYARLDRSGKYLRRRYLTQIFFAVLLCINIWIALVSSEEIMKLFLSKKGKEIMYHPETGQLFNFSMVVWYWLPIFVSTLAIALCAVIQDSGLVSLKKLSGQSEFADTERVGDKLFGLVKGYAGISVFINFYLLLTTPWEMRDRSYYIPSWQQR